MPRRPRRKTLGAAPTCKVAAGSEVRWPGDLTSAQCDRFPADSTKKIGRGSFASAYEHATDSTKVVKFTADEKDAKTARMLKGKKVPGLVRVFDVAELRGQSGEDVPIIDDGGAFIGLANAPIYGIIAERVKPRLDDAYEDARKPVASWIERHKDFLMSIPSVERAELFPDLTKAVARGCSGLYGWADPEGQKELRKRCRKNGGKLIRAIKSANARGIVITDLHQGNWGMRGDEPVILDFGVSARDKDKELPIDFAAVPGRRNRGKR